MDTLFLDSSHYLRLGILDKQFEWIDFREIKNKKGSSILHYELYKLLEEKGLQANCLKKIFLANGPGSYTGIRLAEGIAQIFEWQEVEIYSFYCFEIPYLAGVQSGAWYAEAFKGEVFLYEWDGIKTQSRLVAKSNFEDYAQKKENLYHAYNMALLLKEYPQKIFSKIFERKRRFSPFYFRSLDKEFKAEKFTLC